MQQVAMKQIEPEFQTIENEKETFPWFIIQSDSEQRVHYKYDWFSEFFGEQSKKHDGLGLSFTYPKHIDPGTKLEIGIPLPDVTKSYEADVVMTGENSEGYEIGIWLHTSSNDDLELILRSCEFTS